MRSSRVLVALAVGAASVGGLATMAHAATPPDTIVVLPVFGSSLTVTITSNPDGTLNNVALDHAGEYTANTPSLHKVVFTHSTGDAGKVVVRGKNGSQSTSVRVTKLSDLVGSGSWTGSVFGAGDTESVAYTIGATADVPPKPTLTLGAINLTGAAGVTQTTTTPTHMGEHGDDWVAARVKFAMGSQVRSLSIVVAADNDNDEHDAVENSAKLSIGLSPLRLDATKVTIGAPQTWTGMDCIGGPLTATYVVNLDGSITVSVPATGVTTGEHGGAVVDFMDNVKLFISAKVDGATLVRVSASPKYHCKATDPATKTNVTIVPTPPPSWSDHGGDHKHH